MSILTFHRCFKEVMKLTPLQYQKNLKLQEAQNLMLYKGLTVQQAAFEVGYESLRQFSREYKRQFGNTPKKDIQELKERLCKTSNWFSDR